MQAEDHRVTFTAFAVAGGPQAPEQELPGALPEEKVFEVRKLLSGIEFFPSSGIDLAADAVYVESDLGLLETVAFEAEIFDMVVPAGMFAEGREADEPAAGVEPTDIILKEFFEDVGHERDA